MGVNEVFAPASSSLEALRWIARGSWMASVFLDGTRGCWVLKVKVEGKDKRHTLRPARQGETSKPIPADVQVLADGLLSPKPPLPIATLSTPPSTSMLEGFVESHFQDYRQHKQPGSSKRLRGILDNFLAYARHTRLNRLEEVDESVIKGFFNWRLHKVDPRLKINVQPQTVLSELELLSGVFSAAKERKIIQGNPVSDVVRLLRPSYPRREKTKYLEPEQVKAFVQAIEADRASGKIPNHYADLALVMLNTGLRVSAAINIEASRINTKDWTIEVPPKDDKAKVGYTAAVAPGGRDVLRRRMSKGRLFPPDTTSAMSYYYIGKLAERHGIDFKGGAFNHALRHTLATSLVDAKIPIQTIGGQLGHRNLKTTQRYAQVRDQAKMEAVKNLHF